MQVKTSSFSYPTGPHHPDQILTPARKAPGSSNNPAVLNPDAIRTFVNSTNGRALINRLNSPALASKPLVQLDTEATRQIIQALGQLPAPRPKAKRRPGRPAGESRSVPAPSAGETSYDVVVFRSRAARPTRLAAQTIARTANVPGLTPQQTMVAGTTGGALLGAGVAHILNSVRHVDPTGIGSVIFALAGALAGAGGGLLVAAKVVTPTQVTVPGLKVSFKPA